MAVQTLESVVDCTKFETVAPVADTMSAAANPTGASENVKVSTEESPDLKVAAVEVMATVGAVLSSVNVNVAEDVLPAASASVTTTVWLPSAVGAV